MKMAVMILGMMMSSMSPRFLSYFQIDFRSGALTRSREASLGPRRQALARSLQPESGFMKQTRSPPKPFNPKPKTQRSGEWRY